MNITIQKRDGNTFARFDPKLIYAAILKAADSVGHSDPYNLANAVSQRIAERMSEDWERAVQDDPTRQESMDFEESETIKVEEIQDAVLLCLEEEGEDDVARVFQAFRTARNRMRDVTPSDTAIETYVGHSKYIRDGDVDWVGATKRSMDMHIKAYPGEESNIRTAFGFVADKKVLPSMRSIQFGGTAIEVNHARMYNCSYSPITRPEFFKDFFFLLLSGCGVGYSVQQQHIKYLGALNTIDKSKVVFHRIADTIEGWSDALGILVDSYFRNRTSSLSEAYGEPPIAGSGIGPYIEFDYSSIRKEGAELKTTGGLAPGHLPLKEALETIRDLLGAMQGRRARPLELHRVCCVTALAVLAGGIRRSSCMVLFDPWDGEMLNCKTGDWFAKMPELEMANNSAVNPDATQKAMVLELCQQYGEPGFVHLEDSFEEGVNPCGEIIMNALIATGTQFKDHQWTEPEFGFGFCNLTEVNMATLHSEKDFYRRCRYASYIGTLQAGFVGMKVDNTAERDRLVGVSLTGIADMPEWVDAQVLRKGEETVFEVNKQVSERLGFASARACTTIKPSGTASLLLGGIGSGMHFHHAKRYIRRITAKANEASFKAYRHANPSACVEKPNGDWVVEFAIQTDGRTRDDQSAVTILELQAFLFNHWVNVHKSLFSYTPIRDHHHSVSCTVDVRPNEWRAITEMAISRTDLAPATSFMPFAGDKIYDFAPREAVNTVPSMERWMELASTYKTPDYTDVSASDLGSACEGPSCEI